MNGKIRFLYPSGAGFELWWAAYVECQVFATAFYARQAESEQHETICCLICIVSHTFFFFNG